MRAQPPNLEIVGQGAVFPGGIGVEQLAKPDLDPVVQMSTLSHPPKSVPVRRVDLGQSEWARWKSEARLRRASPISLFLAEAASQALAGGKAGDGRLGLICAFSTGSIILSRKFFAGSLQNGRQYASPALFPETVYNSPVSHLAALLGIRGACYTVVGDETALVDALRVAQTWFSRDAVDQVLLLAGEELDPLALDAYECVRWFRRGMVAAEGAGALLVRRADRSSNVFLEVNSRSHPFRTRAEQISACKEVLAKGNARCPFFLPGIVTPPDLVQRISSLGGVSSFAKYRGSAFTASTAWDLMEAYRFRGQRGPFQMLVPGSSAAVTSVGFL